MAENTPHVRASKSALSSIVANEVGALSVDEAVLRLHSRIKRLELAMSTMAIATHAWYPPDGEDDQ